MARDVKLRLRPLLKEKYLADPIAEKEAESSETALHNAKRGFNNGFNWDRP